MSQIIQLDQQTANSIAAGEVVERPVSVVKELVENALDAEASVIHVTMQQGGIQQIQVTDNGCGMDAEDARLAFGRHATSKLKSINDLDHLMTMGFRGEALASIASVSEVTLETRQTGSAIGTAVRIKAGIIESVENSGCPEGTKVTVNHLFFNIPARFKFLKKDTTEAGHISTLIERLAIAHPDVSFRLFHNNQELLHTPGNNDLLSTIYAVYGRQTAQGCRPANCTEGPIQLEGLVGRPEIARSNREQQCFFVNGRLIRSKTLTAALDEAFKTQLMKKKYAVAFIFITIPPNLADINVHPQKMEVRFWNDQTVFRCVYRAIQSALFSDAGVLESRDAAKTEYDIADNEAEPENDGRHSAMRPVLDQSGNADPSMLQFRDAPFDVERADQEEHTFNHNDHRESLSAKPQSVEDRQTTLTVADLTDAKLIGTLFQTYILYETGDDLLLLDQHAAHEKILFERLIERHRQMRQSGNRLVQDLLVPVMIDVSRSDAQLITSSGERLEALGFASSMIGPASVAIRSVPDTGNRRMQPEAAFRVALEAIRQESIRADDDIESFYYQMACKSAVKAKDRLDDQEIRQLMRDLANVSDPYHCPHGRPVIVRLTRREIEKMFRRIV